MVNIITTDHLKKKTHVSSSSENKLGLPMVHDVKTKFPMIRAPEYCQYAQSCSSDNMCLECSSTRSDVSLSLHKSHIPVDALLNSKPALI